MTTATDECCPYCGLKYQDLRTGLTFADVKSMYWSSSEDSKDWKYKRRNTVLGKWREIKQQLWQRHLDGCSQEPEEVPF